MKARSLAERPAIVHLLSQVEIEHFPLDQGFLGPLIAGFAMKRLRQAATKGEDNIMSTALQNQVLNARIPDARWKDLYRIGYLACFGMVVAIVLAVIIYLIWPYQPGYASVTNIFTTLQTDRLAGLMSLEISSLIVMSIMILEMLALYVALKSVNESYALIALAAGLMGAVLWLSARPLVEMVYLSDQYAAATSDLARTQYLAAGEAVHALFNGTNWMFSTFLLGVSGAISALLMLRSGFFGRTTAYIGIASVILSFGVFIPQVGPMLSLLATIASVIWYSLIARDFYRLGWGLNGNARALK